jgi:hypothetical protein
MADQKLRLKVDIDAMTFDDMIDISEGNMRRAKEIVAKFAVDENDKPLDREQALATVGALPLSQVKATFDEFNRMVTEDMKAVLPNG